MLFDSEESKTGDPLEDFKILSNHRQDQIRSYGNPHSQKD
jgi:hypothetical protein